MFEGGYLCIPFSRNIARLPEAESHLGLYLQFLGELRTDDNSLEAINNNIQKATEYNAILEARIASQASN